MQGRNTLAALVLLFLTGLFPAPARAQFQGYTSPQAVTQLVFNSITTPQNSPAWVTGAVSCTPAAAAACGIQNLGQVVHFVSYLTTGAPQAVEIHLEASIDGATWFSISESATGTSGQVYALGSYPQYRVVCSALSGGTLTAFYSGSSSTSGPPLGTYNSAQGLQKFFGGSNNFSQLLTVPLWPSPTGNSLGVVQIFSTAAFPAASSMSVQGFNFGTGGPVLGTVNLAGLTSATLFVQGVPVNQIAFTFNKGAGGAGNWFAVYTFTPPGSQVGIALGQPLVVFNSESTSAVNTAVTKSIAAVAGQRVFLYSVSARCSAGTAQLQVKDGVAGTVIWSTAITEVSTTTFRFQWSTGLASTAGNGMDIVLGTCGVANTGSLDVQASQD